MENYINIDRNNNYKISCKLWAPSGNVTQMMIACHGFAGDKESSAISMVASQLLDKGIGTIAFDLPGHGESEVDGDYLTIDNCLNDFIAVEEYVRKQYPDAKISIFATSFGAYLTLLLLLKREILYKNVILRCPAIKMDEIFVKEIIREDMNNFQKRGYTTVGYERELKVNYSFYQELVNLQLLDIFRENKQRILIIHGDADTTAPIADSITFSKKFQIPLRIVEGADHRFKKPGELEQVVKFTLDFIDDSLN